MIYTLEAVKTLRHNGQPLDLTVQENPPGQHGAKTYTVTAAGRDSFTLQSSLLPERALSHLAASLQFYPAEVRINGEPVDTRPFPDLAHASVTRYEDDNQRYYSSQQLDLNPEGPSETLKPYRTGNTFIAGVMCFLHRKPDQSHVYHSAVPGPNLNWKRAVKVELSPIWTITDQEAANLTQEQFDSFGTNTPPGLEPVLRERAQAQIGRTLASPALPAPHPGPLFKYFLSGNSSAPFENGAPIIVNGTPIVLDPDSTGKDNSETVSAAEALYRSDSHFVPVQPEHDQQKQPRQSVRSVADFSFTHTQAEPSPEPWCMNPVDDITLEFQLDDEEDVRTAPAPFWLTGDCSFDKTVHFVPSQIASHELAQCMLRAYWDDEHFLSWDDLKEGLDNAYQEYHDLAQAAIEDPAPVFTEQIQRLADRFYTEIPRPGQPVTVTSRDGLITVTSNPKAQTTTG